MVVDFARNVSVVTGSLIKVILLVALVVGIAYAVTCAVGNYQFAFGNEFSVPDVNKAQYSLRIFNTGNVLLTNKLERQGDILILDGYWEFDGEKFRYKENKIELDKSIFGKIEVTNRR